MKLQIVFLLFIAQTGFAQNPFSPFNEIKPKGKIDSVIIDYNNFMGKRVYIYNKQRQLVQEIGYIDEIYPDGIGRILDTLSTKFFYSADGKFLSSTHFHKDEIGSANYKYIQTKYGYAIRGPLEADSTVYEMRFNNKGQMIQNGSYSLNDPERQYNGNADYKYDEKGNLIETARYWDWKRFKPLKQFYKYNNDGNLTAITGEPTSRQDRTFTYPKYDQMRNWTERVFRNGNGSTYTSYRRITYHK